MLLRLAGALLSLLVLSVAALILFFRDAQQGDLKFEVAKALLQLGVVAVIAAALSILTFEYQRRRQREDKDRELQREQATKQRDLDRKTLEYREDLLRSILSEATAAYSRAKKARRLLRARAIRGGLVVVDQYDTFLDWLNDAQLELENLARDVETSAQAFTDASAVVKHLRSMDSHLNRLIKEYEGERHRAAGNELLLERVPLLDEFLRRAGGSGTFSQSFVNPFHAVQKAIRADLLHPNLPVRTASESRGMS